MTTKPTTFCALTAAIAAHAFAQSPLLTMTPAVSLAAPNAQVQWHLGGPIATPHAILADLRGGPFEVYGETFLLGWPRTSLHFAPSAAGPTTGGFTVPPSPGLVGTIVYAQTAFLDPAAPNGLFVLGNGASAVIHAAPAAVVLDFADPVAQGFQGNYRSDVVGHLRGGAVLHRTRDTSSAAGAFFGQPIQSPLVPTGCREQMVFRAQDVGAIGEPEFVTRVSWLAVGVVQPDSFLQFELRAGHTHVTPDYSVDPWSALAVAPASGLSSLFATNELPAAPPATVFLGRYDVDPLAARPSPLGFFVPYPAIMPFEYDGVSSLLLDFRVGQGLFGTNGQRVQLMVLSGPLPAARAVAGPTLYNPLPIPNPGQAIQANIVDCAMPVLEFEFARAETHAESPWLDSGLAAPDYRAPLLAASYPPGTAVRLRFRGALGAGGFGASAWSDSQDVADGLRFLQIDVRLIGNPVSDAVPLVDTLVVPVH